ncbi:hypothetical protein ACEG19_04085 [Blautia stercoris]|uniref:hypothetical protein n=1 Tax=Blautia stercoris TaxID=871664 RepID=UPI00355C3229
MKARFDTEQSAVTIKQLNDKDYIFICLNCEIVKDFQQEQKEEQTFYEYDYTEIIEETGVLDLEDIKVHPEQYKNYETDKKEEAEEIAELKEQVEVQALLLQYLAEMTDVYIPE